ncbi:MAG: type II toxin-antitoxin system RelE/ParE family toxin [Candidatus Methylomirabilales bacterium]
MAAIPGRDRDRITARIRALSHQPRPKGVKALAANVYRLRMGRYRVIYKVFDKQQVILLGKIAPRTERTYKDLESLFG